MAKENNSQTTAFSNAYHCERKTLDSDKYNCMEVCMYLRCFCTNSNHQAPFQTCAIGVVDNWLNDSSPGVNKP